MGIFDWFRGRPDEPMSKDRFAQAFIQELRQTGDTRKLDLDADAFLIRCGDGGIINLVNYYREYCSLPQEQRNDHLKRVVRASLSVGIDLPEDFDEARPNLRPKVWLRAALVFTQLRMQLENPDSKGLATSQYECGEHLIASIAYDFPDSMRTLGDDDFETWGVTYYEALEAARQNLEELPFQFAQIGDGLYVSMTGDSYDSCRLLLPSLISRFELKGDPIALVANRDTLIMTGSEDKDGLTAMAAIAQDSRDKPRPMSFIPLRLEGEDWVDWQLPPDHPSYPAFKELETRFLYENYAEQKELLDAIHERDDIGLYVAKYNANSAEDGSDLRTYALWSKGVEAILPRADFVYFFEEEREVIGYTRWEVVERVARDLMQRTDHYPPRYVVREYPSEDQLERMRLTPV